MYVICRLYLDFTLAPCQESDISESSCVIYRIPLNIFVDSCALAGGQKAAERAAVSSRDAKISTRSFAMSYDGLSINQGRNCRENCRTGMLVHWVGPFDVRHAMCVHQRDVADQIATEVCLCTERVPSMRAKRHVLPGKLSI